MAYAQLFGRDDQVVVKNPTNKDYIFQWDGKRYLLRANSKQPMAGWMAEHYVKEMTNLVMQSKGEQDHLMNETARKPYYALIIVSHSKMASIDSADDTDELIVLGETAVPGAPKKEALKLENADEPVVDKELNIDDLPKDEDLYPDPKKKKAAEAAEKARLAKDKEDNRQPGDLAAEAAADLSGEEDDKDARPDEPAFPTEPKAEAKTK